MKQIECIKLYEGMDHFQRSQFLVRISFNLTIGARGTYEAGTNKVLEPEKLRGFNEIQHSILGQLGAVLDQDPKCYPDEVFWAIVHEKAETYGVFSELSWSLDKAAKGM